ncbi:LysR substrate-binding domain-containing protein [Achromobacter xylosoxidans]|uniref:LysR substrate-binding domain-containing protein n=1 Tax=Alcaligenes xylosoxydans xylosoxydans TaxID=85698 RepID=UPI001F135677|nr:LysR substrate-binding domain-containing protein [Achromobacter xylosoxidans]
MKTTLDEMQVFIAIVDCGSIAAAADALQQTISATSRTMTRLEEKLQTTLMRRTTRRLELTEEGSAYLEQARKIIAAVEETEEQMRARRNQPAGRLRVDAASPFMLHVIVPLVPGYRQRYPKVELELNSNEGNIDLLERRTDLALRIGSLKDSSLHAVPIGRSRVRVLASPGYLAAHGTPKRAADLREHTLLGFSQLESLNEWPLEDADGQPLHIQPSIRSFSGETLRQLALNDAGIVCLSDFMTRADRQSGALRQLFPRQTLDVRQPVNAVYYRNTAISSRIKSFIDYLVESLGPRGFDE